MESAPRASVDISTEESPVADAGSKSFTLTLNKKVVYGLGLVDVVALGALGVAMVSSNRSVCMDAGPGGGGDGPPVCIAAQLADCGEDFGKSSTIISALETVGLASSYM